jgi:hypothetical protein
MCRRVTCRTCGRPTWAGCGAHIEQVLGAVPKAERCQCGESKTQHRAASSAPPTKSWLKRLLGG